MAKIRLDLPRNIKVQPIDETQTLSATLASGEIDALYTARMPYPGPCDHRHLSARPSAVP
jgi:hypothetical protein